MDKISDIWSNGKTRGIIFVIFYIAIFAYIFVVYGNRSEKVILPDQTPAKVVKASYDSYEYDYIIDEKTINVIKNNDVVNFKIDDVDYYYINNKCYKLEEEKFHEVENPLKYNFDYLNNLDKIKKLSILAKKTTYMDGVIEENYNISLAELLNVFGITEEVDAKEITNYSIFSSEKVSKIIFHDLNFEIKYKSFNDVSLININYEFYEGEE